MPMLFLSLIILFVALTGYYLSVRKSKLESEIRKNKIKYECFDCKSKFSVNEIKCPKCNLITLYGQRKKKFWLIIPIIISWIFMVAKFARQGML